MMPKLRPISLAAMLLLSGVTLAVSAQEARRPYIIQLQDQPAATYTGGITGLPATQPQPGARFDYYDSGVQDYVRYLDNKRASVQATVANAPIIANYDVVVNGFAAMLTDAEVLQLKSNAAVADVQADVARNVDTVSTADFLKLTASGGLYSQFAGGALVKGEDMVVGIVDGGIWPENPAFADRVDANGKPTFNPSGTLAFGAAPASFKGGCVAGEGFDPVKHCNNKLIGAKYYNAGFLSANLPKNWTEYYSPRDSNVGYNGVSSGHGGHGDHTASTAAGNAGVAVVINGIPMGEATGVAPRARVSSYKVCWTYDDPTNPDGSNSRNSCFNTDSVAAIDEAVKDGVNVLNYSISGSQTSSADIVEQAFYRASLANVFVAASAGNSGPANAVAHISPWVTTVAASTHDRNFAANVILGNGGSYSGASTNTVTVTGTMIRSEDAALGAGNASFCYSANPPAGAALLDPAKVAGKIVVCTRGDNARVDKSLAVLNAGGIGMVLVDGPADTGPVGDIHSVPSVHLSYANGVPVKAYAATAGATATINPFSNQPKPAPVMAGFSSRGPNQGDFNIMKPDMTAPGVDVIASVTPSLTPAQRNGVADGSFVPGDAYASYQGTSMSSPHVAGIALLLRQLRPTWSPAAIKSALMTTAFNTVNDNLAGASNGLLPWSQGAGHVDPNKAANPGLVYDLGKAEYVQYQCKVNKPSVSPASDCNTFGTLDETYNLNLPSITVGQIQQSVTVRRTVTNVTGAPATFNLVNASVPGFTTEVSPTTLTIPAGGKADFTVKLTKGNAATNTWYFGELVWSDGATSVRSPMQARAALSITSPGDITSDKTSGSKLFLVKTLFSGTMSAIKGGLKEVSMGPTVSLTPNGAGSTAMRDACRTGGLASSIRAYDVVVPAGTIVARFALRQQDTGGASQDHDLGVLTPAGAWVYQGNDFTNEALQFSSPAAGTYRVCVLAWGGATNMTHKLSSWVVTPSDTGGNLVVAIPGKVVANANTTVGMSWSGLQAGKRYLGGAQFRDMAGNVQSTTVLRIDTGSAAVPSAETGAKASKTKE